MARRDLGNLARAMATIRWRWWSFPIRPFNIEISTLAALILLSRELCDRMVDLNAHCGKMDELVYGDQNSFTS